MQVAIVVFVADRDDHRDHQARLSGAGARRASAATATRRAVPVAARGRARAGRRVLACEDRRGHLLRQPLRAAARVRPRASSAAIPGGRSPRVVGVGGDVVHEPLARRARARSARTWPPKRPDERAGRDRHQHPVVARASATIAGRAGAPEQRSGCASTTRWPSRWRSEHDLLEPPAPPARTAARAAASAPPPRPSRDELATASISARWVIAISAPGKHLERRLLRVRAGRRAPSTSARDRVGVVGVARVHVRRGDERVDPRRGAPRAPAPATPRSSGGPSSMPGSTWQCRSITLPEPYARVVPADALRGRAGRGRVGSR